MERVSQPKGRLNNCHLPLFHLRRIGPQATQDGVLDVMDITKVTSLLGRNRNQVDFLLDSSNAVASQYISRLHARIVRQENNSHRLFDDSLNGIFINNTKMQGSVVLREGDVVTFGHPFGVRLAAGVWKRQPDSEYQFIFERCCCPLQDSYSKADESVPSLAMVKDTLNESAACQCGKENLRKDFKGSRHPDTENSTINESTGSSSMHDTFVSNVSLLEKSFDKDGKDTESYPFSPVQPLGQMQCMTNKVPLASVDTSPNVSNANLPRSPLNQSVQKTILQEGSKLINDVDVVLQKPMFTPPLLDKSQDASGQTQSEGKETVSEKTVNKRNVLGFSDFDDSEPDFCLNDVVDESVMKSVLKMCQGPLCSQGTSCNKETCEAKDQNSESGAEESVSHIQADTQIFTAESVGTKTQVTHCNHFSSVQSCFLEAQDAKASTKCLNEKVSSNDEHEELVETVSTNPDDNVFLVPQVPATNKCKNTSLKQKERQELSSRKLPNYNLLHQIEAPENDNGLKEDSASKTFEDFSDMSTSSTDSISLTKESKSIAFAPVRTNLVFSAHEELWNGDETIKAKKAKLSTCEVDASELDEPSKPSKPESSSIQMADKQNLISPCTSTNELQTSGSVFRENIQDVITNFTNTQAEPMEEIAVVNSSKLSENLLDKEKEVEATLLPSETVVGDMEDVGNSIRNTLEPVSETLSEKCNNPKYSLVPESESKGTIHTSCVHSPGYEKGLEDEKPKAIGSSSRAIALYSDAAIKQPSVVMSKDGTLNTLVHPLENLTPPMDDKTNTSGHTSQSAPIYRNGLLLNTNVHSPELNTITQPLDALKAPIDNKPNMAVHSADSLSESMTNQLNTDLDSPKQTSLSMDDEPKTNIQSINTSQMSTDIHSLEKSSMDSVINTNIQSPEIVHPEMDNLLDIDIMSLEHDPVYVENESPNVFYAQIDTGTSSVNVSKEKSSCLKHEVIFVDEVSNTDMGSTEPEVIIVDDASDVDADAILVDDDSDVDSMEVLPTGSVPNVNQNPLESTMVNADHKNFKDSFNDSRISEENLKRENKIPQNIQNRLKHESNRILRKGDRLLNKVEESAVNQVLSKSKSPDVFSIKNETLPKTEPHENGMSLENQTFSENDPCEGRISIDSQTYTKKYELHEDETSAENETLPEEDTSQEDKILTGNEKHPKESSTPEEDVKSVESKKFAEENRMSIGSDMPDENRNLSGGYEMPDQMLVEENKMPIESLKLKTFEKPVDNLIFPQEIKMPVENPKLRGEHELPLENLRPPDKHEMPEENQILPEETQISVENQTHPQETQMSLENQAHPQEIQMSIENESLPEETQMSTGNQTLPEETQMSAENQTLPEETQMSTENQTLPEETQMSTENQTLPEETKMSTENQTLPEETQMSVENQTFPEETQMSMSLENQAHPQEIQMSIENESLPEETQMSTGNQTLPEETQMSAENQTLPEETQMSTENQTLPEETQMSAENQTLPEETKMSVENQTLPEETQMSVENQTFPEETQMSIENQTLPEKTQMSVENQTPEEYQIIPVENQELPAVDQEIPAENEEPPEERQDIPPKDPNLPEKNEMPPVENQKCPQEEEVCVEDQTLPQENEISVDNNKPPGENKMPEENQKFCKKDDLPKENQTLPQEIEMSVYNKILPEEHGMPTENQTIQGEIDVLVGNQKLFEKHQVTHVENQGPPDKHQAIPVQNPELPEEDQEIPVKNQEPPEDHKGIPVENQAFPEDYQTLPVENQEPPKEHQLIPVQNQELPEEDQEIPVENQEPPEDNKGIPVENQAFPEEYQAMPVENLGLPEDYQAMPVENQELSEDDEMCVENPNLPEKNEMPIEYQKRPEEDEMPVETQTLPQETEIFVKEKQHPEEDKMPVKNQTLSRETEMSIKNMFPKGHRLPAENQNILEEIDMSAENQGLSGKHQVTALENQELSEGDEMCVENQEHPEEDEMPVEHQTLLQEIELSVDNKKLLEEHEMHAENQKSIDENEISVENLKDHQGISVENQKPPEEHQEAPVENPLEEHQKEDETSSLLTLSVEAQSLYLSNNRCEAESCRPRKTGLTKDESKGADYTDDVTNRVMIAAAREDHDGTDFITSTPVENMLNNNLKGGLFRGETLSPVNEISDETAAHSSIINMEEFNSEDNSLNLKCTHEVGLVQIAQERGTCHHMDEKTEDFRTIEKNSDKTQNVYEIGDNEIQDLHAICKDETQAVMEISEDEMQDLKEICEDGTQDTNETCDEETHDLKETCEDEKQDLNEICEDERQDLNKIPQDETQDLNEIPQDETQDLNEICEDETQDLNDMCGDETQDLSEICEEETQDFNEMCEDEAQDLKNICEDETQDFNEICEDETHDLNEICDDETQDLKEICKEDTQDLKKICEDETQDLNEICEDETQDLKEICKEDTQDLKKICEDETQDLNEICEDETQDLNEICEDETQDLKEICKEETQDLNEICEDETQDLNLNEICEDETQDLNEICEETQDWKNICGDEMQDVTEISEDETQDMNEISEDETQDMKEISEDETQDMKEISEDGKPENGEAHKTSSSCVKQIHESERVSNKPEDVTMTSKIIVEVEENGESSMIDNENSEKRNGTVSKMADKIEFCEKEVGANGIKTNEIIMGKSDEILMNEDQESNADKFLTEDINVNRTDKIMGQNYSQSNEERTEQICVNKPNINITEKEDFHTEELECEEEVGDRMNIQQRFCGAHSGAIPQSKEVSQAVPDVNQSLILNDYSESTKEQEFKVNVVSTNFHQTDVCSNTSMLSDDLFIHPDQPVSRVSIPSQSQLSAQDLDGHEEKIKGNSNKSILSNEEIDPLLEDKKLNSSSSDLSSEIEFKDEEDLHLYWSQASSNDVSTESVTQTTGNSQPLATFGSQVVNKVDESCDSVPYEINDPKINSGPIIWEQNSTSYQEFNPNDNEPSQASNVDIDADYSKHEADASVLEMEHGKGTPFDNGVFASEQKKTDMENLSSSETTLKFVKGKESEPSITQGSGVPSIKQNVDDNVLVSDQETKCIEVPAADQIHVLNVDNGTLTSEQKADLIESSAKQETQICPVDQDPDVGNDTPTSEKERVMDVSVVDLNTHLPSQDERRGFDHISSSSKLEKDQSELQNLIDQENGLDEDVPIQYQEVNWDKDCAGMRGKAEIAISTPVNVVYMKGRETNTDISSEEEETSTSTITINSAKEVTSLDCDKRSPEAGTICDGMLSQEEPDNDQALKSDACSTGNIPKKREASLGSPISLENKGTVLEPIIPYACTEKETCIETAVSEQEKDSELGQKRDKSHKTEMLAIISQSKELTGDLETENLNEHSTVERTEAVSNDGLVKENLVSSNSMKGETEVASLSENSPQLNVRLEDPGCVLNRSLSNQKCSQEVLLKDSLSSSSPLHLSNPTKNDLHPEVDRYSEESPHTRNGPDAETVEPLKGCNDCIRKKREYCVEENEEELSGKRPRIESLESTSLASSSPHPCDTDLSEISLAQEPTSDYAQGISVNDECDKDSSDFSSNSQTPILSLSSNMDNQTTNTSDQSSKDSFDTSWLDDGSEHADIHNDGSRLVKGDTSQKLDASTSSSYYRHEESSPSITEDCFDIAGQRRKRKREKLHTAIVNELVNLNKEIRMALAKENPNITKAVSALEDVEDLPVNEFVLKKCPAVLETLSKCQKYKESEQVRHISRDIYAKFQEIMKGSENKRHKY